MVTDVPRKLLIASSVVIDAKMAAVDRDETASLYSQGTGIYTYVLMS